MYSPSYELFAILALRSPSSSSISAHRCRMFRTDGLTEEQRKEVAIALYNVPFDEAKGKDGLDEIEAEHVRQLCR